MNPVSDPPLTPDLSGPGVARTGWLLLRDLALSLLVVAAVVLIASFLTLTAASLTHAAAPPAAVATLASANA